MMVAGELDTFRVECFKPVEALNKGEKGLGSPIAAKGQASD